MTKPLTELQIVIIHDKFPPVYAGGGEYVVYQLAKNLSEQGCQVHVITAGDPTITQFDGIKTTRLPCSPYAFNFKWKEITKLAGEADVIHGFTYHGLYPAYRAAKALNVPFVKMVLALFGPEWLRMKGPFLGRLFAWHERFLINLPADKQIFISDFSLEYARSLSMSLTNACVIQPGISLQDYCAAPDKEYVMFAGKIEARKGVNILIDAAEKLPQVPFLMTGWGNNLKPIDLPKNMTFVDFENRQQMAGLLSKALVFVFPTRVETFGLAVAEAMASGCAIVSSSQLQFEGYCIDKNDHLGFITAIKTLWDNRAMAADMGNKNQQIAQQYNWLSHIQKTVSIYRELAIVNQEVTLT